MTMNANPTITITHEACDAIKETLEAHQCPLALRIDIRSSGCCDGQLSMAAEKPQADDLTTTINGLTVAIPPEIHKLVGDISITYKDDGFEKGFFLDSEKPLNEWAGFSPCSIRI